MEQKEEGACGDSNDSLENKEFINGNISGKQVHLLKQKELAYFVYLKEK